MKIVQNGPKAFKNVEGRGRPNTFLCLVTTTVIPRDSCKMQYESLPETEQRQKHLRAHGKVFADTSEEKSLPFEFFRSYFMYVYVYIQI